MNQKRNRGGPGGSGQELRGRVMQILKRLGQEYQDPRTALGYGNPLELLVATVLSAQCTDERVNQVTRGLFKSYKCAEDYARADLGRLEEEIRPTGYFRQKARTLKAIGQGLVERFHGEVPGTLEELVSLPGVGRKTANLVLSEAFGVPAIVVDTHVQRLAGRIGLSSQKDPVGIEFDLMELAPKEDWSRLCNLLIWHGRRTCVARKPRCGRCAIRDLCDYPDKTDAV
jgi:endonuclease-3